LGEKSILETEKTLRKRQIVCSIPNRNTITDAKVLFNCQIPIFALARGSSIRPAAHLTGNLDRSRIRGMVLDVPLAAPELLAQSDAELRTDDRSLIAGNVMSLLSAIDGAQVPVLLMLSREERGTVPLTLGAGLAGEKGRTVFVSHEKAKCEEVARFAFDLRRKR
jgi:hypothetical protein